MNTTTTNKVYIETHGCQMNVYDSSKMLDVLRESHGLLPTACVDEAQVILLNTCSVREKAQEKVFSELGRFRALKEKNPHIIIGVGGCVASQEGEALLKRAPFVDLVFGPQTLHRIGDMINERRQQKKAVVDISFPEIEKFDRLPEPKADGVTAFVTIMEGCSKYCSFCVVPYTRGEEISRPLDDVLAEIVTLTEQGVKEITLLGQNVNDYRGPMHDGGVADLATLIEYMGAIDALLRIRFMTSHPLAFSERLISVYGTVPKLSNYLHLPVQSGSDRILAAMKRGYTALEFKSKIKKLRKIRPDISLSSDFIVGFPGETDADFEKTMDLVHEVGFDQSYSFIYSPRPGTPAAQFPDDVSMAVKKERLNILQARLTQQGLEISSNMVGSCQMVLVTGASPKHAGHLIGRTDNFRVVDFKAPVDFIGKLVPVMITDASRSHLLGVLSVDFPL